jgi:hypothetical protein
LSATVEPQPLRRNRCDGLSRRFHAVFDQTFFEKVCDQAIFEKVCDQAIFEKVCDQAFFEKACGTRAVLL